MSYDYASAIEEAGQNLAEAVETEMALEDERPTVKLAAIERIMRGGVNPMTNKAHSFSSAEAAVSTDADYQQYQSQIRQAAVRRIVARARYDAAVVNGQLAKSRA